MVTFERNRIMVAIDHLNSPEDLRNIQLGIINAIQFQFVEEKELNKDLLFGNYMLLELLKALLESKEGK